MRRSGPRRHALPIPTHGRSAAPLPPLPFPVYLGTGLGTHRCIVQSTPLFASSLVAPHRLLIGEAIAAAATAAATVATSRYHALSC